MLAYEVLKIASQFCDDDELSKKITSSVDGLNEAEKTKTLHLLECLNLVQDEIATEYLPLIAEEKVFFQECKLPFSSLQQGAVKILSVKNKWGHSVKFKVYPTYIICPVKEGWVRYIYRSQKLNLDSVLEVNAPARTLAYGVAREHFLAQGLDDDADLWEMRFKDSLQVLASKHNGLIKGRRWL